MAITAATFNRALGAELRIAREMSGFTVRELVERSQIKRSTLMNYLSGASGLSVWVLYQICSVLDVDPREVLSHTEARLAAERNAEIRPASCEPH